MCWRYLRYLASTQTRHGLLSCFFGIANTLPLVHPRQWKDPLLLSTGMPSKHTRPGDRLPEKMARTKQHEDTLHHMRTLSITDIACLKWISAISELSILLSSGWLFKFDSSSYTGIEWVTTSQVHWTLLQILLALVRANSTGAVTPRGSGATDFGPSSRSSKTGFQGDRGDRRWTRRFGRLENPRQHTTHQRLGGINYSQLPLPAQEKFWPAIHQQLHATLRNDLFTPEAGRQQRDGRSFTQQRLQLPVVPIPTVAFLPPPAAEVLQDGWHSVGVPRHGGLFPQLHRKP